MPTPSVSAEELQLTYDLFQSLGNAVAVGIRLGISKSAVNRRLQKYEEGKTKFTAPKLPSKSRDIEQLIKDRIEESRRAKNADASRDLIRIPVHIDGPFGLLILGDPHVDDAGCDFELLAQHRQIIKDHPFILGASVGDYQNGWIGRLGALYGEQQTTSKEAWKLVDWLVSEIKWLFLIAGNHDLWAGVGDPLEWIAAQQGSLYEPHGVRIELHHPCGAKTRVHARHDFPGTSIYSQLHGPRREAIMGYRDDLIICGHKHTGACETFVTPDGNVCQIVRVSGYKVADSYAKQLGLKKHNIFPGALCIINPSAPNTSPDRIFTAPSIETGVIILDALRAKFESSRGVSNVQKHKQKTRSKQQSSGRHPR